MLEITLQDKKDIQGLLVYGYAQLRNAHFILFQIEDVTLFKTWLANTSFQNSEKSPVDSCLNIAFTARGLEKIIGKSKITKENGFDQSFLEGIDTEHRNRILGDYDHNDPKNWKWGNKNDDRTHGILMIYATNQDLLEKTFNDVAGKYKGALSENYISKSIRLANDKEHFGFTDGISQPVLNGLERGSNENNFINPGEIILGHKNAYDRKPLSPEVDGVKFGKNGSYMVFRDMQQDVKSFWRTILKYGGDPVKIASKMVGRWPNGIPLILADTEDEAIKLKKEKESSLSPGRLLKFLNDFQYYEKDKDGLKCPIGAHIRRGNPKDSKNETPKNPNEVSNKHRILRRGKSYGEPLVASMEIKDIIAALDKPDNGERGLNFICFNSDIKRQFEFIQQTWVNNMKFVGLYDEVDPIIGVQGKYDKVSNSMKMMPTKFGEPACPYRHKYNDIPPFVKVRAGGYFFFPGITAIKFLAK